MFLLAILIPACASSSLAFCTERPQHWSTLAQKPLLVGESSREAQSGRKIKLQSSRPLGRIQQAERGGRRPGKTGPEPHPDGNPGHESARRKGILSHSRL